MKPEKDAIQKAKEYNWICKHIIESKNTDAEKKWRKKADNWRRANPEYAKAIDVVLQKEVHDRVINMTPTEYKAWAENMAVELERRKKIGLVL